MTVMHEAYEIARHRCMERRIAHGEQQLALEDAGAAADPAVVGLHGLTATRRYVLMGSRLLERSGRRAAVFDARGHGASSPAPGGDYSYAAMAADLAAVLDALEIERALLAGTSMGAHTALRFALEHPERVTGLLLVTPAYDPDAASAGIARWDALAAGLRDGGIDGFVAAFDLDGLDPAWRETAERAMRQRLAGHTHPVAVADALSAVPRSRPFASWRELERLVAPTVVVGSRDESDPQHPLATARRYADNIPGARLVVEDEGRAPIAWQGGQLSRLLLDF
jgi:pimeloyl-ACP methyl ester carboxylesterase